MSIVGAPGSEDRKKFIAMCGFAVLAAGILYYEFGSSTPATPPPPVITTAPSPGAANTGHNAKTIGTTAASLDPTLHMEPMRVTESITYEGTGRNIFSPNSAPPVAIPKQIASARPNLTPTVVTPPVPTGPPLPPPIDLKFIGYFSSPGGKDKQVILLHGDDVVLAHAGDIVLRRYRVVSIASTSIQVEDMPNNNKQTLPLLAN